MYDAIAHLLSTKEKPNEVGDLIKSECEREVFVEEKSIRQSEFYQAHANGLKPEIMLVLADYEDYQGEKEVAYEGFRYKILRIYKTGRQLEITCYGGVNYGSSEVSY